MRLSELPLEVVADCPLCHESGARDFVSRGDGMQVVQCTTCSFLYLNPRPVNEALQRIYSTAYYESSDEMCGYREYLRREREALDGGWHIGYTILDLIEQFEPLLGKKVIEVGSGSGSVLRIAAQKGATVQGIESCAEMAQYIQKHLAMSVMHGSLEDADLPDDAFDLVLLCEVIEHLSDPLGAARQLQKCLKPGGLLFLTTPNAGCTGRFGGSWYGFHASYEHVSYFDMASLNRLIGQASLDVLGAWSFGDTHPDVHDKKSDTASTLLKSVLRSFASELAPSLLNRYRRTKRRQTLYPCTGIEQAHSLWLLAQKAATPYAE